jgi:multidrug efflux pump subunit AcrA (membrane-fusion protein)
MSKDGVVSKQALDDAQQKYLAAVNIRDRAVSQIAVDTSKLHQAKAQVEQAQASLKQLEEQLSYTTIVTRPWMASFSPATLKSATPSAPSSSLAPPPLSS